MGTKPAETRLTGLCKVSDAAAGPDGNSTRIPHPIDTTPPDLSTLPSAVQAHPHTPASPASNSLHCARPPNPQPGVDQPKRQSDAGIDAITARLTVPLPTRHRVSVIASAGTAVVMQVATRRTLTEVAVEGTPPVRASTGASEPGTGGVETPSGPEIRSLAYRKHHERSVQKQ